MAYYPGQRVKSTNPRRLTLAKLLLGLGILALIYFGVIFVPPYWRYYRANSVMAEATNAAWRKKRPNQQWEDIHERVEAHVRRQLLVALKIPRDDLKLKVERVNREIHVTAKWIHRAKWLAIDKVTNLSFEDKFSMSAH